MMHNIPELKKDSRGYVYWRSAEVEHFSFSQDRAGEVKATEELARRCRHLEALGIRPCAHTVTWAWEWFADMTEATPRAFRRFLAIARDFYEHPELGLAWAGPMGRVYSWKSGSASGSMFALWAFDVPADDRYHTLIRRGWSIARAGQAPHNGSCYATTEGVLALLKRHGLTESTLRRLLPTTLYGVVRRHAGTVVSTGPFESREEADRVAQRLAEDHPGSTVSVEPEDAVP